MESDLLKVGANVDIQRTDGTLGIPKNHGTGSYTLVLGLCLHVSYFGTL